MAIFDPDDLTWMQNPGEECCVNFKDSVVVAADPANRELQGMVVEEAVSYSMIQRQEVALVVANRDLCFKCYPLAKIRFVANRYAFRLQVGDLFKLNYAPYGISGMVFRVAMVMEESLKTENIQVEAIEDFYHISNAIEWGFGGIDYPDPGNVSLPPGWGQPVESLTTIQVQEAPYFSGYDGIYILPMASREIGYEIGYVLYMSTDGGSSYTQLQVVNNFTFTGSLVLDYTDDTLEIDDEVGFYVDMINGDLEDVESITRDRLLSLDTLSMIGDEIITFQNIEPVEGQDNRYYISGVYRGRFDTKKEYHSTGSTFTFIGSDGLVPISNANIDYGATLFFKAVPYSGKTAGDLSEATPIEVTIDGRAYTPYSPNNLQANSEGINPFYAEDVVLTWSPRLRSSGAGIGLPDTITDAEPTWEGKFRIRVQVGGSTVRTTDEINAISWTYTEAMNLTDNTSLASSIIFILDNYLTYTQYPGTRFYSESISLTVKLAT